MMRLVHLFRSLVFCGLLYFTSGAPSTSTPAGHVSPTPNPSPTTHHPNELIPLKNSTEHTNIALEIVSDLADHHSSGPRFLADTGSDGDLSDNEAYYIGAILLVNAVVFFGVVFYLLTPWTRMCSWFGNCKYNAGQGYYPTGLGHSLDDAARMMNSFNMFDHRLSKRSTEFIVPILKTIAEAYDRYERSSSAKEK